MKTFTFRGHKFEAPAGYRTLADFIAILRSNVRYMRKATKPRHIAMYAPWIARHEATLAIYDGLRCR